MELGLGKRFGHGIEGLDWDLKWRTLERGFGERLEIRTKG